MLSTIRFCVKFTLLSLFILVLGNWVNWDGKTLSEHVKVTMVEVEKSQTYLEIQGWVKSLTSDARKGIQKRAINGLKLNQGSQTASDEAEPEEISSTERQKLKALIRELNTPSRAHD